MALCQNEASLQAHIDLQRKEIVPSSSHCSRYILTHYGKCKNSNCIKCRPFREYLFCEKQKKALKWRHQLASVKEEAGVADSNVQQNGSQASAAEAIQEDLMTSVSDLKIHPN